MMTIYAESIFLGTPAGNPGETNRQANGWEWNDLDSAPCNAYIPMRKILVRNENRTAEEDIYVDEKIMIEVEFI